MALTSLVASLLAQLGGFAILAGTLAAVTAIVYRWYVREAVPRGLALLMGLAGVAIYLNTSAALGQVIGGAADPTTTEAAIFNIAAFGTASGGAALGRRTGDRFATDTLLGTSESVDEDVSRLVKAVGRVITVELPEDIDDAVGYDPVPEATKKKLSGKAFVFPRQLTVGELRRRFVERITTDYAVGHVDVEFAEDGSVRHLALGARAAGIGPTLPPATNAVAVRADPAFAASAGDIVQVWETDPMRRVLTAELRGISGDVATIAIDAADTPKVDPTREYRLVTLPVKDRPDREFASLLRAAEETFSSVTVEAGSPLHGMPVGALDVTITAVTAEGGTPEPLPGRARVLEPGDELFAIATSDALRRLEQAAEPLNPALVDAVGRRPTPPGGRDGPASDRGATAQPEPTGNGAPPGSDTDQPASESPSQTGSESPSQATGEAGGPAPESDAAERRPDADSASPDDEPPTADDEAGEGAETGPADGSSFQELKEQFEEGTADWDDADASAGDDESHSKPGSGADDLDDLSLTEEEDDEGIGFKDDTEEGHETEGDGKDGEEVPDGGTDADGGDAKSFQELKEEFEEGEADWEDDISDSPGGDMALDPDE